MSQILIAGQDWQSRALLRAQLLEEGFDVEAYETVSEAVAALSDATQLPDLLIADLSVGTETSDSVNALSQWSHKFPIWIIASRTYIVDKGLRGYGFEMILLRPVDVGELVDQIKRRLGQEREIE